MLNAGMIVNGSLKYLIGESWASFISQFFSFSTIKKFLRNARRMALEKLHPNIDDIIAANEGKVGLTFLCRLISSF